MPWQHALAAWLCPFDTPMNAWRNEAWTVDFPRHSGLGVPLTCGNLGRGRNLRDVNFRDILIHWQSALRLRTHQDKV